jgi:hypothetical protein
MLHSTVQDIFLFLLKYTAVYKKFGGRKMEAPLDGRHGS